MLLENIITIVTKNTKHFSRSELLFENNIENVPPAA